MFRRFFCPFWAKGPPRRTRKSTEIRNKPKKTNAKMNNWKNVIFERRRVFLKNGGLNGWMITAVFLKIIDKKVIKQDTTNNKKNRKLTNLHPENDVLKTSKSLRSGNYYGLRKSRVGRGMLPVEITNTTWRPFCRKWCAKGGFWDPAKSQKGAKIDMLSLDGHLCR